MNNTENIVNYHQIGDVRYVQNRQAKNLSIRINQQGEVRVTIPRYVSRRKAETFLMSKRHWILAKLSEIKPANGEKRILKDGDLLNVRGKAIPIVLKKDSGDVEEAVWSILLEEARDYLPDRVEELATQNGFRYSSVKVRRMKNRWGSCTAKNAINLNSWLVMLPEQLSDYVILHELVHTRHRDHSKSFWEALDRVTEGSSKMLRKELRGQRILFFPENDKPG